MTETSARFALPLLQPGQAQKELYHNEALVRIDAALHAQVAATATNDPPATPVTGSSWIVGAAPTGAWIGHAGELAHASAGGWRFIVPVAGMTAWVASAGRWAWHDGTGWRSGALPTGGIAVNGQQVIAARQAAIAAPAGGTTIDAEARACIAAILTAMRAHGLINS
ncbi:DUF2793 domain-containing protein [Sphingomonas profundi]|uniref:DUF2793 domain-containing protein n=1 Tax=Alterirhizorhabdus profundi TaxID=2681549 RepID=UPI0030D24D20